MSDEEKKILAFLTKVLFKVVSGNEITDNDIQSLDNIMGDIGSYDLKEREFRW